MAMTEHVSSLDATPPGKTVAPLFRSIKSFARFLSTWATSCADYYAAAAMYENLSRLSDAELHRRGLSRETLGRDVCRACDRTAGDNTAG